MRWWLFLVLLLPGLSVYTNENSVASLNAENKLFIVTVDGLRWQEVFGGADPALLPKAALKHTLSPALAFCQSPSAEERRRKLMPFFWNVIAREGALYGNRTYGNKMNVANPYALSYPGYNELLTGRVDLSLFGNGKAVNPNFSVLHFLNTTATYRGKVAAFTSWNVFPYILNEDKSSFYINSGFENPEEINGSKPGSFLNIIQGMEERKATRKDELTFLACKTYIEKQKPSVVFLSFGGTDEAAHSRQYGAYLQQAASADHMIGELWNYLQHLPEYAGKTTLLITTDHGRGKAGNWYTHGAFVGGSSQTWMCLLGKNVKATGECKAIGQLHQKDLRNLMLRILSLP